MVLLIVKTVIPDALWSNCNWVTISWIKSSILLWNKFDGVNDSVKKLVMDLSDLMVEFDVDVDVDADVDANVKNYCLFV